MLSRSLGMVAALLLVVGLQVLPTPAPSAQAAADRIGGADRFETSAMISRADPSAADVVFLASSSVFSDALAAAPVAASARGGGRLLLTGGDAIPAVIVREIERLAPREIVVVGGPATIAPSVEERAAELAPAVSRVSGRDRVEVSLALLDRQSAELGRRPGRVWVVSGSGFSDALSAASVAARYGDGMVLTTGVSEPFGSGMRARLPGVSSVVIAGGPSSVAPDVEAFLRSQPPSVERIGGTDRYAVSVAINQRFTATAPSGRLLLASGAVFTDGLSGAVLAGALESPMYLTPQACAPNGAVSADARRLGITRYTALGGPDSVSPVAAQLLPCAALDASATDLLQRINAERANAGLRPLAVDGCLTDMAAGWASAMAAGNMAGTVHNPSLTAEARACTPRGWGENVGRTVGANADPARIMTAWMGSDPHRVNILKASFTHIGIGIDRGSNGSWYYVLDFGTR